MITEGDKPNAPFKGAFLSGFGHIIRGASVPCLSSNAHDAGVGLSNECSSAALNVIRPTRQLNRRFARTESCLPPGSLAWHPEV